MLSLWLFSVSLLNPLVESWYIRSANRIFRALFLSLMFLYSLAQAHCSLLYSFPELNEWSIARPFMLKISSLVTLLSLMLWNHLAFLLIIWMYLLCPPLKALSTIPLSFSFRSSEGISVYNVGKSNVLKFLAWGSFPYFQVVYCCILMNTDIVAPQDVLCFTRPSMQTVVTVTVSLHWMG